MDNLQTLFQAVDQLTDEERRQLYDHLAASLANQSPAHQERVFDLHPDAIQTSDDFDAPLSDKFWFGSE